MSLDGTLPPGVSHGDRLAPWSRSGRTRSECYDEFDMDLAPGNDVSRALVDGMPLPLRVLRYLAAWGAHDTWEGIDEKRRALADKAIEANDCSALYVGCTYDIDDGTAENIRDVCVFAEIARGQHTETVPVPVVGAWLHEWLKEQAESR